jgi:hypothetical protein
VFVLSLLAACGEESSEYPPPILVPENVKSAATGFLEQQQVEVADYELELLGFDYVKRTWRLRFSGKSGVLHDTYWLVVADDNINEISLREN